VSERTTVPSEPPAPTLGRSGRAERAEGPWLSAPFVCGRGPRCYHRSVTDEDSTVTDARPISPDPSRDEFLVVIYAKDKSAQGRRQMLRASPVRVGRMSDNEIVLDDDAVSRRHARLEKRESGWAVMDVGSRNGTLVNDREISGVAKLAHGDRLKIGYTIFKYLSGQDAESAFFEEIYQLTITDNLTQVHNRRHFDDAIEREVSRARRFKRRLSLLMLDIDYFKRVNDDYGHLVGDAALREIAQLVQNRVRRDDTVARYGGEEFVVLMPETPLASATSVARALREEVARRVIEYRDVRFSVTVSIGCAELLPSDMTPTDLVLRVDSKLFAAKHAGRNCVL
jgi:two-component system cell cycle response regulator